MAVEEDAEYESTIWATPYYVAPEKIRREKEDFLSDMYSLGGTLYHALTGRVPFDAPTVEELIQAHVSAPLIAPIEVAPDISPPTSEALVQSMAKDPRDRFRTYDEFIMVLEGVRSQLLVKKYVSEREEPPGDEPVAELPPGDASPARENKGGWWRR
jgi:serine/threonine protein kinase